AEDGRRDRTVTGVQTCALPIYARALPRARARPPRTPHPRVDHRTRGGRARRDAPDLGGLLEPAQARHAATGGPDGAVRARQGARSEERRVGRERMTRVL